jgi:hypothetical protein
MLFKDPVFLFLLLPLACCALFCLTPRYGYRSRAAQLSSNPESATVAEKDRLRIASTL